MSTSRKKKSEQKYHYIGSITGPTHVGTGDININFGQKYDVNPGDMYDGSVYRTKIKDLEKIILIGRGSDIEPTIVKGSVAGFHIKAENYILIEGSVTGLKKVELGFWNYIKGNLIGDEIIVGKNLTVENNIFAKNLTLAKGAEIGKNIVCQKIIDSKGQATNILPIVTIKGAFVCSDNVEIANHSNINAIITPKNVRITSSCNINSIVAGGNVYLREQSTVSHIECNKLIAEKNVMISTAFTREGVDIGENSIVRFLYSEQKIDNLGNNAQISNSTLLSRKSIPTLQNIIFLEKKLHSKRNALGITKTGIIIENTESASGILFTNLINRELLKTITTLTKNKLSI